MKPKETTSTKKISFTKARKRASLLSTSDLEQAVYAHLQYVSDATSNWRRSGGDLGVISQSLEDGESNSAALVEIFRELKTRSTAAPRQGI